MRLGRVLLAYQQKYDLTGAELAAEIGISESLLTRIKQGHMPAAHPFMRIMVWLTVGSGGEPIVTENHPADH